MFYGITYVLVPLGGTGDLAKEEDIKTLTEHLKPFEAHVIKPGYMSDIITEYLYQLLLLQKAIEARDN